MSLFPNQSIPEKDKNLEWVKLHLHYGENILNSRNGIYSIMTRLYESYNGIKNLDAMRFIEKRYGRANKSKFISYRLGRNKLTLLSGEWLNQPLHPTVVTINSESKISKLEQEQFIKGAVASRDELGKLKDAGVDVLEGMELPEGDPDEVWNNMSYKDKNEHAMQLILDTAISDLNVDLKNKFSKNFTDIHIASMCYGKKDIDEDGNVNYFKIDPRDAIFDEIEGDDYLQRCPLKGARFRMTVSEVLRKYKLTKEQKETLKNLESKEAYTGGSKRPRVYKINGDLCVDVIHVEWITQIPTYYKFSPKTQSQMEVDSSVGHVEMQMGTADYENNKESYDRLIEKGKILKVDTKWAQDIREAVMIGGVIVIDLGRKKFQPRSVDKPNLSSCMSYSGYLFNTVDGVRVSLQQVVENFDSAFDICMYQILKELNIAKGKIIGYNRAALPQGKKMTEIMYDVINDGFIDYDSSADGNESGSELRLNDLIQVMDVGVSTTFQQLIIMKNDIRATLDLVTGINENRQGDIAASSTAANAAMSVSASRNITTPMFWGFNRYVQMVLTDLCEMYKISYAFFKVEKGRQILGDAQQKFIEIQKEIGYCDYGVYLEDGARYNEIKGKIIALGEASLNAKQITLEDLLKLEASQSYAEAKSVLEVAAKKVREIADQQLQAQLQSQQQMQAQQLKAQQEMALENREDVQLHDLAKIDAKANADIKVNNAKQGNQMFLDQNKFDNEGLNNDMPVQQ